MRYALLTPAVGACKRTRLDERSFGSVARAVSGSVSTKGFETGLFLSIFRSSLIRLFVLWAEIWRTVEIRPLCSA